MKKTKRKAFNFLRSYFDVVNKLQTDEDKLSFLMAIINKQFLNEDPEELKFPVDLAYDSQINAIDSSVKGWIRASKVDLQGKPQDTPPTPSKGKTQSNPKEEEEEEKEKGEYTLSDKQKFLSWFNKRRTEYLKIPSHCNTWSRNDIANHKELKRDYTIEQFEKAMKSFCKDKFYLDSNNILPNYFLQPEKFVKFLNAYNSNKAIQPKAGDPTTW